MIASFAQTAPLAAQPASPPTLLKIQAPIESFSRWVDQSLVHFFPVRPALVWMLHLLLALILTVFLAWFVGFVTRRWAGIAGRRGAKLWAAVLEQASPTLRWMVLLGGLSDAIEDAWPVTKGPVHWLAGSLFVLSAIIATRGVVRVVKLALSGVLPPSLTWPRLAGAEAHVETPEEASSRQALVPLAQRLISIVIWLIGLILVLDHFNQNVGSVVAALGVTSLAIGLAAQQALSNIIAGLVLAVDRPFRPGDRIKLVSGESGDVLDIGMRSTQIRLPDGGLLVIPNADLVSSRLINQSTYIAVRAEVRVSVPVLTDVDRLIRELHEDAKALDPQPLLLPPVRVHVLSVSDKVEVALVLWIPRSSDAPAVEEKLRRAALKRVQALLPAPPTIPPPAAPPPPKSG